MKALASISIITIDNVDTIPGAYDMKMGESNSSFYHLWYYYHLQFCLNSTSVDLIIITSFNTKDYDEHID